MSTSITYPHILKPAGEPARLERIPRLRVSQIVADYLAHGWSPEEMCRQHPDLRLSEAHSAMAYILDDEYLSGFFWEEPSDIRAGKSKKARFDARTWYVQGNWRMILDRVLERVYLLRCQLVHGAATHGGKLNRDSLRHCVRMMRSLMNAVLLVLIDFGDRENRGLMCYPPLS